MKKLLFTMCSAVLVSIAGMAQQDTTQSNQYRNTRERQQRTEQKIDSVENEVSEDARREGQNIRQGIDSTSIQMQQETEQAGDTLMQELEKAGNEVQGETEQAEESIQQNKEEAAGDMNQNDASEKQSNENTASDSEATMNQPGAAQAEVEVLEGKEGPNNEVVYKYQGELYYVDRNEKKMVKVKESDLRDTKHEVKIHEGTATDDSAKKTKKTKG